MPAWAFDFDFDCSKRGAITGEVECGCGSYDPSPLAKCSQFGYCTPVNLGSDRGWRKLKWLESRPKACSTCEVGRKELIEKLKAENRELYKNGG